MKLQQTFYFFILPFLSSCFVDNFEQRVQEDEALQKSNSNFFENNQLHYGRVEKIVVTAKAQGNEPMEMYIYDLLESESRTMYAYLFEIKISAIGLRESHYNEGRLDVVSATLMDQTTEQFDWDKTQFSNNINSFFQLLESIPKEDSFHQNLLHSDLINYERKYTEEELLSDLLVLKNSTLKAVERLPVVANRLQVLEFTNLSTAVVLLAERKALRFLEEHYMNTNILNSPDGLITVISSDKVSYAAGSEIAINVFPSFIYSPNLFVKQYTILGPELNDSFLIKGTLSYKTDTIWLPTERTGAYRITGSALNFLRPNQEHNFEYNYRVIEE